MNEIPAGFEPNVRRSPVSDPWEPLFAKETGDAVIFGLTIGAQHTNGRGFLHGGLVAALADKATGHSCGQRLGGKASLLTVSLSLDYIGSAQIGQWLTFESDVLKAGGTLCFVQCMVKADGELIARGNATFKVVRKKG